MRSLFGVSSLNVVIILRAGIIASVIVTAFNVLIKTRKGKQDSDDLEYVHL